MERLQRLHCDIFSGHFIQVSFIWIIFLCFRIWQKSGLIMKTCSKQQRALLSWSQIWPDWEAAMVMVSRKIFFIIFLILLINKVGRPIYRNHSVTLVCNDIMFSVGLSRVTDYSWVVRFSEVTGYKFTNRLTGSCTDDLLETRSCQNHEKVEETLVNPSYIWAKCVYFLYWAHKQVPGSQSMGIFSR